MLHCSDFFGSGARVDSLIVYVVASQAMVRYDLCDASAIDMKT